MMGHMDVEKYTVTVFTSDETSEAFQHCTDVNNNIEGKIIFDDSMGKRHEFSGVPYHIVQE